MVCQRKAVADSCSGCFGIHVRATPTEVKKHVQKTMHKAILNRIGVHAMPGVREHGVILDPPTPWLHLHNARDRKSTCRSDGWKRASGPALSTAPRVPQESPGTPALHRGRAVWLLRCRSSALPLLPGTLSHFSTSGHGNRPTASSNSAYESSALPPRTLFACRQVCTSLTCGYHGSSANATSTLLSSAICSAIAIVKTFSVGQGIATPSDHPD